MLDRVLAWNRRATEIHRKCEREGDEGTDFHCARPEPPGPVGGHLLNSSRPRRCHPAKGLAACFLREPSWSGFSLDRADCARRRPLRRNVPQSESSRRGSSNGPASGRFSRELTCGVGRTGLTAGESHGLENPLVAERRLLIDLLFLACGARLLDCLARDSIIVHSWSS